MTHCLKLEYLLNVVGDFELGVGTLLLDMGKVSSKLRVQIPWECLNLAMFMLYMFV